MKKNRSSIIGSAIFAALLLACGFSSFSCSEESERPADTDPMVPGAGSDSGSDNGDSGDNGEEGEDVEALTFSMDDVTQSTAFNSGTESVHTFRIPTITTAPDGSLIVAGEARHYYWSDKSYSDVHLKRSTDDGLTWSSATTVTGAINSGSYAFMDPLLITDKIGGTMWLFTCRWIAGNSNCYNNRAFVSVSTNNGQTWNTPTDITDQIVTEGAYISGFGPGSGFQIAEGLYENRLIVPTRQTVYSADGTSTTTSCTTVYSDDYGQSWSIGNGITPSGECQMADCGNNTLTLNVRASGFRRAGFSTNGGVTWGAPSTAAGIPGVDGGCQASVLGVGGTTVLFCGIEGGTATDDYDNRCKLAVYRSVNGAITWPKSQLLYEAAAGYCCMTSLDDGRVAIVFEAGDGEGFTKNSSRSEGWMRLDVMVLPKEVIDSDYWFEEE